MEIPQIVIVDLCMAVVFVLIVVGGVMMLKLDVESSREERRKKHGR